MSILNVDWAEMKLFVDVRSTSVQYIEFDSKYILKAFDGPFNLDCLINKTDPPNPDQLDFETNYKPSANQSLQDTDGNGRNIVRFAATQKGWHYQAHSVSFDVGQKDSIYNKNDNGDDLGFSTIKFYDALKDGNDITDSSQVIIDATAKKTVVKWSPTFDFEVVSGSIRQISKKSSDLFLYVNAKVQTGYPAPYDWLKVPFVEGGINLNYIGADEPLETNGRAPKLFKGSIGDHFEIVINHGVLEKHRVTVIFEIYKDPLS